MIKHYSGGMLVLQNMISSLFHSFKISYQFLCLLCYALCILLFQTITQTRFK